LINNLETESNVNCKILTVVDVIFLYPTNDIANNHITFKHTWRLTEYINCVYGCVRTCVCEREFIEKMEENVIIYIIDSKFKATTFLIRFNVKHAIAITWITTSMFSEVYTKMITDDILIEFLI